MYITLTTFGVCTPCRLMLRYIASAICAVSMIGCENSGMPQKTASQIVNELERLHNGCDGEVLNKGNGGGFQVKGMLSSDSSSPVAEMAKGTKSVTVAGWIFEASAQEISNNGSRVYSRHPKRPGDLSINIVFTVDGDRFHLFGGADIAR
ncbi:MAG: hypothetical protein KDN04_09585 [Verrucomicrobiae bacterium]|nr:hypothetical protein [Verrucomicrobiae bacterium]